MSNQTKVRMAWANISPNAKKYVRNVLDRGWLSSSLYIPRFERDVAYIHGAKHGILVNSGTDALRISLATLKELHKWPDQAEVIVPAVTFVATVNAILQNNLKPIFADVDLLTANLDPASVHERISRQTKCVIPVHLFGLPVEFKWNGKVVEDSCETFGVHKLAGEMACFSFYVSHHVSTGVGGMILTNSDRYARLARSYMNHGRIDDGSHFQFGRSGYSSRITEMEAALGIAALEHYSADLEKRRRLADAYIDNLAGLELLQMPPVDYTHSWMFMPLLLKVNKRNELLNFLKVNEVESREAMPLISQPVFKRIYKKGSCPNAELWTNNGILLPLHPQMKERDVEYVASIVRRFFCAK